MIRFTPSQPSLLGETPDAVGRLVAPARQPPFRSKQLMEWLYKRRAAAFAEMTNLPAELREWLEANFRLNPARLVLLKRASDVTEKLLLELEDRSLIETVLIRYPQRGVGVETARRTICVSSQVGCAYGCRFCASGLDGWKRNLTAAEIVAQFLHVCHVEEDRRGRLPKDALPFDNVVFMGMGEPLANYDAVMAAIRALNAPWGLGFGARRITVSTSGLVPEILRLAEEPVQFRLAVSLHGATNEVRTQIMPVNRKYPLESLVPAVKSFAERRGRMVTLEYILIEDVNDTFDQAEALTGIAREVRAHVNLIPYNRVEGLPWKRPNLKRQEAFARILRDAAVPHTIRKEKGHDIDAACGQLRLRTEQDRAAQAVRQTSA